MDIFKELPLAFPWYDKIEKQFRFRENADRITDWGLIAPSDALLPFQFFRTGAATIAEWLILDFDGNAVITIAADYYSKIKTVTREGRVYFYYDGSELTGVSIPSGFYYSRLKFSDNVLFYSEAFCVPECSFLSTDTEEVEFLKLEWWNDSDISPVFYNDFTGGLPYFKNVVYLDSFIHVSEPEIIEDGEKDGRDEQVATFQKAILRYRITELVPDFLKVALVLMQMHDEIYLTTRKAVRSGKVDRITTSTTTEANGLMATIDLVIEDDLLIKKGCGNNMA